MSGTGSVCLTAARGGRYSTSSKELSGEITTDILHRQLKEVQNLCCFISAEHLCRVKELRQQRPSAIAYGSYEGLTICILNGSEAGNASGG